MRQAFHGVWVLSAVYASPNAYIRDDLWEYLERLHTCISLPWLLLWAFNQVLSATEKAGGNPVNRRNILAMQQMVSTCSLIDLGFSGSPFTWSNMRVGTSCIKERLDMGLCNQQFLHRFPDTLVLHLPRVRSDHHPYLSGHTQFRTVGIQCGRFGFLMHGLLGRILPTWLGRLGLTRNQYR